MLTDRDDCIDLRLGGECLGVEWPAATPLDARFGLETRTRTYYMYCQTPEECLRWLESAMRLARNLHYAPRFLRRHGKNSDSSQEIKGLDAESPPKPAIVYAGSAASTGPYENSDSFLRSGPEVAAPMYSKVVKPSRCHVQAAREPQEEVVYTEPILVRKARRPAANTTDISVPTVEYAALSFGKGLESDAHMYSFIFLLKVGWGVEGFANSNGLGVNRKSDG